MSSAKSGAQADGREKGPWHLSCISIIPTETPNAFATGRNPSHAVVAVTEGILRILSRDELEGVLGHELAHVKHRDILIQTVAATLASAISFLAFMARWGAIFGGVGGRDDNGGAESWNYSPWRSWLRLPR